MGDSGIVLRKDNKREERRTMKFLAIIEVTAETMTITLDKDTMLDTQGLTLPHQIFAEFVSCLSHPQGAAKDVIELWEKESK